MEWFTDWWNNLMLVQQILYCIAVPATLILIIQTIMLLVGFGHLGEGVNVSDTSGLDLGTDGSLDTGGADMDMTDGSSPFDYADFRLFTIQGIIAFFCIFGWSGLAAVGSDINIFLSLVIAFVLGALALVGVAKLIQLSSKLAQNGTVNIRNMIGQTGSVYLTVPAGGAGEGKVTISTSERFLEFSAVTNGEALLDNTPVKVVGIKSDSVLIVEKNI